MSALLFGLYGFVTYLMFLGSFLYAIGFVGNIVVPKTIDSGPVESLPLTLIVDLLLGAFAIQHSLMARPAFKRWWTRLVMTTGYIVIGIFLEERDLIALFGDQYRNYRTRAGMLLPRLRL